MSLVEILNRNKKLISTFITPYTDVERKYSSSGHNIEVLDGIRGLAVLIVLASHSNSFGMYGQGSLGVLLFFFLSGYVLSLPFMEAPEKILSFRSLYLFCINRILRIVPIYMVVAALTMIYLGKNLEWYLWNVSFMKGWNHFWSVAEEIRFYIIFPLVICLMAIVRNKYMNTILLLALVYFFYKFQHIYVIDMMDGRHVNFYLYMFLGGCLTCFLVKYQFFSRWLDNDLAKKILSLLAAFIFVFLFSSSANMVNLIWRPFFPGLPENFAMNGWAIPHIWLLLFIVFFFSLTFSTSGFIHGLLSNFFFRHIGLLSYSIYLSHVIFLLLLQKMGLRQEWLFFSVFAVSYVFSFLSYICIEKPFLLLKHKLNKKSRKDDTRLLESLSV